ncbi:MAG: bifunctional phosphoribosyl-AMP cyclohydrolase/phosphoribosyl-ATP diphosphatase HisIE [Christensenellales bacterium]|jgi:phosphoribosyl-ATP pyrophosphohydrolase/phosphoribosyl-AMP cyclohydrolase
MDLRFDEKGLIPAVVQHAQTGRVLMMAYMNRESLQRTMDTGLACFFSRSRQQLWTKGETSGHYLHVQGIAADCDSDALLVTALPDGPTCHTGEESCFFEALHGDAAPPFSLEALMALIADRRQHPKEGSYTNYLFDKGLDKILKKVGEESTEVIVAGKGGDRGETIYEIADLAYHVLVLMAQMGISVGDIRKELAGRHVIDKKTKQETSSAK